MNNKVNNAFILLLSGRGERLYSTIKMKKQYYPLEGKEIFLYPLETAIKSSLFSHVILVVEQEDLEKVKMRVTQTFPDVDFLFTSGGETRNDSVYNGLKALAQFDITNVVIHDADRPFLSEDVLVKVINKLSIVEAVTCYVPLFDSLLDLNEKKYIQRDGKKLVYTPQGFSYPKIKQIYDDGFDTKGTDDFSKALDNNLTFDLVEVSPLLFKITDEETLKEAKLIAKALKKFNFEN